MQQALRMAKAHGLLALQAEKQTLAKQAEKTGSHVKAEPP